MNRREFLSRTGAGLAAASIDLASAQSASPRTTRSPDVAVIGAGTFGAWTAFHLNRMGARVLLLDAYGPGNSRASSGGETRQMQADRTADAYLRSSVDSYVWWKRLEDEARIPLVLETGKLMLSTTNDHLANSQTIQARHREFGLAEVEILDADELRYRWPQLHSDDLAFGAFAKNAGGSVIMARRGVGVVADQFVRQGGQLKRAYCTPRFDTAGRVDGIETQNGDRIAAGHYVFACGPWLARVFPDLLEKRLQVQRRDVLFFGSPPGNTDFAFPRLPTWSVAGSGFYGFPDIEKRGFKVAPYPDRNAIDPDVDERLIVPHQVKRCRDFLRHRFPGLGAMPVTETRVCQVTNTSDGHFMAGLHPGIDNVSIVGGGSGHGFKHGPAIGEHAAKQVLGQPIDPDFERTFGTLKAEFV